MSKCNIVMNTGPMHQHGVGAMAGGETYAHCETHNVTLGPGPSNADTQCPVGAVEELMETALEAIEEQKRESILAVQHQQEAGQENASLSVHPRQEIYVDSDDVIRFVPNVIVQHLLDHGPTDMNMLATMNFSDEDRAQFAQLIGYSVSGFGELDYASQDEIAEADEIAARLTTTTKEGV